MEEKTTDDNQSYGTDNSGVSGASDQSVPEGRQVMDVTAPVRKKNVADDSSDLASSDYNNPYESFDGSDEPAETPEVSETPKTESNFSESSETSEAEPSSAVDDPVSSEPTTESFAPSPEVNSMGTEQTEPPTPVVDSHIDTPAAGAHENATSPHAHAKSGAPMIAITIAVVVALGLAGSVIFAYMKDKKNGDIKRNDSESTTQTTVEKPQASASDVDSTNTEIDGSLEKANDTTDFPTTELSDSTLGL